MSTFVALNLLSIERVPVIVQLLYILHGSAVWDLQPEVTGVVIVVWYKGKTTFVRPQGSLDTPRTTVSLVGHVPYWRKGVCSALSFRHTTPSYPYLKLQFIWKPVWGRVVNARYTGIYFERLRQRRTSVTSCFQQIGCTTETSKVHCRTPLRPEYFRSLVGRGTQVNL